MKARFLAPNRTPKYGSLRWQFEEFVGKNLPSSLNRELARQKEEGVDLSLHIDKVDAIEFAMYLEIAHTSLTHKYDSLFHCDSLLPSRLCDMDPENLPKWMKITNEMQRFINREWSKRELPQIFIDLLRANS